MTVFDSIIIASTLHEPEFRLRKSFEKALSFINKFHPNIIISCTSFTSSEVINTLQKDNITVRLTPNDPQIDTYSFAIRCALDVCEEEQYQRIFYIDFDRLLHWINNYPSEIMETMKDSFNFDLLHIGRSDRAFKTHPRTQRDTEKIINHVGSKILGFSEDIDIISVSYIFTPELGHHLLRYPSRTTVGFYGAWPLILWNHAKNPEYIEVEGHEWETPDRYHVEIDESGYEKWSRSFQSTSEWKKRVRFVDECLEEMMALTDCCFKKI
ncbi:MAG: hypothetical protein BAJALOKI3v1_170035 [Promethearchaeota archaeon]|nr:MAG: hypothetical protein BAJALOKI3v1_170035 [Candidatus Lokiarchaeota archaeon]